MDGPGARIPERWRRRTGSIPPEFAGVVALAAVLRCYRLGAESLWLDEAYSVTVVSTHSTAWLLFEHPTADPHPPLYYVVLKVWTYVLGTAEVVARFPSAVFGVGTVVGTYYLGRRLFDGDRRTAAVAALLVAVSPFHVRYAQEARMYALLAFLSVASYCLLVGLLAEYTRRRAAAYAAVTVLLGYTHVYGLFVVLAQAVYLAAGSLVGGPLTLPRRRWLGLHAAVGAALSPWLFLLGARLLDRGRDDDSPGTGTGTGTDGGSGGVAAPGEPVTSSVPEDQVVPAWIPEPRPALLVDHLATYAPGAGLDNLAYPAPAAVALALAALGGVLVLAAVPPLDRWIRRLDDALRRRVAGTPTGGRDGSDDPGVAPAAGPDPTVDADAPSGVPARADRTRYRRAVALLGLLVAVPVAVPYVVSSVTAPILVPRYTLPASVGFYVLLARGIRTLPRVPVPASMPVPESSPDDEGGSGSRSDGEDRGGYGAISSGYVERGRSGRAAETREADPPAGNSPAGGRSGARRAVAVGPLALLVVVAGMVAPLGTYYAADQHVQWAETASYLGTAADADDVVLVVSESLVWRPVDYYFGRTEARVAWAAPNASLATVGNRTRPGDDVFLVFAYASEPTKERLRGMVAAVAGEGCYVRRPPGDPRGRRGRGEPPTVRSPLGGGGCEGGPVETVRFRGIDVYRYD